ncbi:hypothetical protein [Spirosoma sp. KUDC1026]|uniref:hypothetical protein n=1 Tax=Spirosoma sp. KUDC1026 TaxID=2745947 RepID=UPI00159BBF5B|nr:hypothetical protein [Spirosoma sp. KUDC1026]QKZ11750.1 hypothetical protein HU175_03550 [Spirosoma sp. KUDC1026]
MKSILLSIRDFHFINYTRKGYPEEKAYKEARQSVIAWLLGWYTALLISAILIGRELSIRLIPKLERNYLNDTLVGLMAMAPYVVIMWQITRSLNDIPVDKTISYKRLAWTAISVAIGGVIMTPLLPFLIQEIINQIGRK